MTKQLPHPKLGGIFGSLRATIDRLERAFHAGSWWQDSFQDDRVGKAVRGLYSTPLEELDNMPQPNTVVLMNFGFWTCKNKSHRQTLQKAYLSLLKCRASLDQIATAWENDSVLRNG